MRKRCMCHPIPSRLFFASFAKAIFWDYRR